MLSQYWLISFYLVEFLDLASKYRTIKMRLNLATVERILMALCERSSKGKMIVKEVFIRTDFLQNVQLAQSFE